MTEATTAQAFPVFTDDQRTRLRTYGTSETVSVGDTIFRPGDVTYDLVLIEQGAIDIVTTPDGDAPEEILVQHHAGNILGELNLLTGQRVFLTARVSEGGAVCRVPAASFRRLMAEDTELSDLLLKAFLARREIFAIAPPLATSRLSAAACRPAHSRCAPTLRDNGYRTCGSTPKRWKASRDVGAGLTRPTYRSC